MERLFNGAFINDTFNQPLIICFKIIVKFPFITHKLHEDKDATKQLLEDEKIRT